MKQIPEWSVNSAGTQISRTFVMGSFVSGLAFVAKIAVHAEVLEHHPDIELTYSRVKVKLSTHDAKGLTALDFDLAKRIDEITPH